MSTLSTMYFLLLLSAAISGLTIFIIMKKYYQVKYFFNFIGGLLVFVASMLFFHWFFNGEFGNIASLGGYAAVSVSASSWTLYFLIATLWYLLAFHAKKKCDWHNH